MYYPKSQITTDLYTDGQEFQVVGTSIPYIGDYYKVSTGQCFTGKNPNSGQNLPLQLLVSTPIETIDPYNNIDIEPTNNYAPEDSVNVLWSLGSSGRTGDADPVAGTDQKYLTKSNHSGYSKISNIKKRLIPFPYTTKPTNKDLEKGFYKRYFVKNIIQTSYFEISKETFKGMDQADLYAVDLYEKVSINFRIGNGSISKNLLQLTIVEKSKNWPGFSKSIPLGLKKSTNLYTKGYEFTYLNRNNYVGFYHYMNNGQVMTGKSHEDGPNIKLISLKNPTPLIENSISTQTSSPSSGGGGGY